MTFVLSLLQVVLLVVAISTVIYIAILGLILTFPMLQRQIFYLHNVTLTRLKGLDVPEGFGFLRNQVTPFSIETVDGETLYAWHIIPPDLHHRHRKELLDQPSGFASDITSRLSFQLLRDDPDARLLICLHGVAGTVASGWRPESYRALSSGAPDKIHILAVDYRGYGLSSGTPSEEGLLLDAIAVAEWAMSVAGIPASRIVIFGQSLGTAVAISTVRHFALQQPPIAFAGLVLVASFSDIASLVGTYRVGGFLPLLSPLTWFRPVSDYFIGFVRDTWPSNNRIAEFVQRSEKHNITLIHAADDREIPCLHTESLYWHAVNATTHTGISFEELEREKGMIRTDLGQDGSVVEWKSEKGVIREEISKHGGHNKIMTYPVTAAAVLRTFQCGDPELPNRI